MRRGLAFLLTVLGGLTLAAAGGADWAVTDADRTVAGVQVEAAGAVSGLGAAPLALPIGLAAVAGGILLALLRSRARVAAGSAVTLVGLAGLATVAAGWWETLQLDAAVTAAPGFAAAGALMALAGGLAATRRSESAPALPPRFDLDAEAEDAEWELASDPQERDAL